MRKHKKDKKLIILAMSFLALLIFALKAPSIQAAVPTTKEVYDNTPAGMNLKDFLEIPSTYPYANINNSAQIIPKDSTAFENDVDIIQMLDANASNAWAIKTGSFWGNVKENSEKAKTYNYFDLSKSQTISAWMYFGDSYANAGDGMAFVLQNDARGAKAISSYNGKVAGGETLGVWGGTATPTILETLINNVGLNAIQNSFALEFDTTLNQERPTSTSGKDDSFDSSMTGDSVDIKGQHISWAYPALASTYNSKYFETGLGIIGNKKKHYYYEMKHNILAGNAIISGYEDQAAITENAWRHMVVNYTPPVAGKNEATLEYIFNDKYYDGTPKKYAEWDRKKFTFDVSNFNSTDGKILWGFTAATGSPKSKTQVNSIIMEAMPAVASIIDTVTLTDLTQNRVIQDLDQNSSADSLVNDGDNLQLSYDLKYTAGMVDTGEITTSIGLPQHVDFTPDSDGNIGKIVYGNKEVNITQDQLTTGKNYQGETINLVNLTIDSMNLKDNHTVSVQLFGQAKAPESDTLKVTTVNQEHTSYRSDNYVDDAVSPKFKISNEKLNITKDGDIPAEIKYSESITLNGIANYLKGTTFDGNQLSVHARIDGGDVAIWNDVATVLGSAQTKYSNELSGETLGIGNHEIEVYLTDSKKRVSNILTYNIRVSARQLNLVPEKDTINVIDNKPVTITGNYEYSDKTGFENAQGTISYQIKNEDEEVGAIQEKIIEHGIGTLSNKFDLTLNPIADNEFGLKEGRNEVTVTVSDGDIQKSNTVTYVINVPKIQPEISTDEDQLSSLGLFPINLPMTYTYPGKYDSNTEKNVKYQLGTSDLRLYTATDGVDNSKVISPNIDSWNDTPYDLNTVVNSEDLGITSVEKAEREIVVYTLDPYNRKSNELKYTLNILTRGAELTVSNSSFKTVEPQEFKPGYIERNDDWSVSVKSYDASWKLNAASENMRRQATNGEYTEYSNLSMYFINGDVTSNLSSNPEIASDSESETITNKTSYVSASWKKDGGILLKANKLPQSGNYQGQITWSLEESL